MTSNKKKSEVFSISRDPKVMKFRQSRLLLNDINIDSPSDINTQIDSTINTKNNQIINNNLIEIKVILNYSYQKDYFEFNLKSRKKYNPTSNKYQFCINDIIDSISTFINNKNIFLNNTYIISYYLNTSNSINNPDKERSYISLGVFPSYKNKEYYLDIPIDNILYLKFRKIINKEFNLRFDIYEQEKEIENEEIKKDDSKLNYYNTNCKRAKERTLDFIIRKVFQWKELRNLTDNKMSLVEAASMIGLSKKSLDEYFTQIKEGRKYGFDFNKYKFDKVNKLRGYVKKKKECEKNKEMDKSNESGDMDDISITIIKNDKKDKNNTKIGKKRKRNK